MKVTLYSWNVNGIRAVLKKDAFLPFIKAHQPDILCLQETKAQHGQAEVDLPDYYEYWADAERKGYSGTAIYSKVKPLEVRRGFPSDILKKYDLADKYGDSSSEGRILAAEFEKFWVVTVYTPNSKGDLSRVSLRDKHWDPAFLAYCQQLETRKPVIFCGDLNVAHTEDDLARPQENVGKHGFTDEERAGFEAFLKAGYVDTFRLFTKGNGYYTWWTNWGGSRERNVGWRIDYFMVSKKLKDKVQDAQIHPDVMGSDHCPVSLILEV